MKAVQNNTNLQSQNTSGETKKNTRDTSLFAVFVALLFPTVQTVFIIHEIVHLIGKSNTTDKVITLQSLIIISLLTLYVWLLAVCTCYVTRLSILKYARNTTIGLLLALIGYCLSGIIIEITYETYFYDVQFLPLTFMFLFYYLMIRTRIKNIIGWNAQT